MVLQPNEFYTCIPLTGKSSQALCEEIKIASLQKPEFFEWRRDYFEEDDEATQSFIFEALKKENKKIIYTFRDKREGGAREISNACRLRAIQHCIQCKGADLIDIELDSQPNFLKEVRDALKHQECGLLLSHHNFETTYSVETMVAIFQRMENAGADVLKLAVTSKNKEDVNRLIRAASLYKEKSEKAMILISMGELGKLTRVFPEYIGSCLTYVCGQQGTAPGQVTMEELHTLRHALNVE